MNYDILIKFISIIYHPEKFPLPKRKLVKILQGLFQNKQDRKLIYKNFTFSSDYYWINDTNDLFEPKQFSKILNNSFNNSKNSNIIWAFAIAYNNQDKKLEFTKKIAKFLNQKDCKTKFLKFLYTEIDKLKDIGLYKENYYNLQNLKQDFETCKMLENMGWELERIVNPSLAKLLDFLCIINKSKWFEVMKKINNPFIACVLNLYYRLGRNKKYNEAIFKFLPNSNDFIISLAIFNYFDFINYKIQQKKPVYKYINNLLDKTKQLKHKKFYWYGVILSNAEYYIHDEKTKIYINKATKKQLIQDICSNKRQSDSIKYLKIGLKITPSHTSYQHLDIYKNILKTNETLSIKLMQCIIEDYKNTITKERCFIPLLSNNYYNDKSGINYTNNVIFAITELTIKNKLDVFDFFENLFKNFYLTKEDYLYNFSKMISEKSQVLHIFLTLFYVIENLEKTQFKIDGRKINDFYEKFVEYTNIHLEYSDNEITNCMNYIFGLKISIDNNILYKTVDILINRAIPSFKPLAILIHKTPENHKIKEIRYFIENYFDKYSKFWLESATIYKNQKFQTWYEIWMILKDKARAKNCIIGLPKYKQEEYLQKIDNL